MPVTPPKEERKKKRKTKRKKKKLKEEVVVEAVEADEADEIIIEEPDAEPDIELTPDVEIKSEIKSDVTPDVTPEIKSDVTPEPEPDVEIKSDVESEPEPDVEIKSDVERTPISMSKSQVQPDGMRKFLQRYPVPLFNKIAGLVYGSAVAEQFGVQADNMTFEQIQENFPDSVIDMPTKSCRGIEPTDWGGNTDQLIVVIDTLIEHNCKFRINDFTPRLRKWCKRGFPILGDLTGVGMDQVTRRVISNKNFVDNPYDVSSQVAHELDGTEAANGSIVRGAILSISDRWQTVAIRQAMATHNNSVSVYASWIVTSMCRDLMRGVLKTAPEYLKNKLAFIKRCDAKEFNKWQKIYECKFAIEATDNLTFETILQMQLEHLALGSEPLNSALKTAGCAFYVLNVIQCIANNRSTTLNYSNLFYKTMAAVVNQGGDTDTNAAVVGCLLGSWLSYTNLLPSYVLNLKHKRWLDNKLIKLFENMMN